MVNDLINKSLIEEFRKSTISTAHAIANDLSKVNQLVLIDPEMALVRIRRVLDLIIRNIANSFEIIPGTKPLEQLLVELNRTSKIPALVQKHCRLIKEFGNFAAHGQDPSIYLSNDDLITETEVMICAQSITIVSKWYLDSIKDKKYSGETYSIVFGNQVTQEMIDQAIEIDILNYPQTYRGVKDICYEWLARNPQIYTMIIDPHTKNVVGYINAMPLEQKFFDEIKKGKIIDVDLPAEIIRQYTLPDFYAMYFSSIGIAPSYRNTIAFRYLYEGFIKNLISLARDDIFISEIIADAVTPEGMKLCQYAGMSELCKTNHDSTIYGVTLLPPALRVTISSGKTLLAFYKNKYEEFKEVINLKIG